MRDPYSQDEINQLFYDSGYHKAIRDVTLMFLSDGTTTDIVPPTICVAQFEHLIKAVTEYLERVKVAYNVEASKEQQYRPN